MFQKFKALLGEWFNGKRELIYLRRYRQELRFLIERIENIVRMGDISDDEPTPEPVVEAYEAYQNLQNEIKELKLNTGFIPLIRKHLL